MNRQISFESEYILHHITQNRLEELFDLELVASEKQLYQLRPDNLAFDKKNKSLVIIEYKNKFDKNVLNQVQGYHNLILENKDEYSKLVNEKIDFDNIKILIISPKFSDDQIKNARDNVELWKVSLFDDCNVEYLNLKSNEIKTIKINPDDLKITEENLLDDKTDETIELYKNFKNRLFEEFDDLNMKFLIDAVSIKAQNEYLCIVTVKSSIKIHYYAEKLEDSENRTRDISDITTGGPLSNYELTLNSENIDYAIELIKQVYNQKVIK
ncbi:MAG: hypothetical protein E7Z81_07305 [Methanobrevibacter sp.]|uniref:DUF5655 domain-containing protein n=1 Tax=Methanobrevibacter sp. TaxID=66852 RepID=UPI0025E7CD1F|nr:DUF5655 domain-containing protein [Methanobrevibacter sp.]MBE6498067.1 hypothetical protein [Methanobrevibacter sp.]